jgi:hypothetical protein
MKYNIYLDDIRTPTSPDWVVVRNYEQFIEKIQQIGLANIENISLDHDLGESAINEYHRNVAPNYMIDYNNISEKTGYDCAKWLVNYFYSTNPKWKSRSNDAKKATTMVFPTVYTHSANPIGAANIMGYINNFLCNEMQYQSCIRVTIPHTI